MQILQLEFLKRQKAIFLFYSVAVILFFVASKAPYRADFFLGLLIATGVWGLGYVYHFGFKAKSEDALFSWLFFFCLFPKLELQKGGTPVLLNVGLVHNLVDISYFSLMEFFIFTAILCSTLRVFKWQSPQFTKIEKIFLAATSLVTLSAVIHLLILQPDENVPVISSVLGLLPFYYCLTVVLTARSWSSELIEKTLELFILFGVALLAEYIIGKADWVPFFFSKYSFNYRNAFKSVFMAGDLMVGLFLISCCTAALHFFYKRKNSIYFVLFLSYNLLMIETLNRAHWMPFCIAVTFLMLASKKLKFPLLYLAIIFYVLIPLSGKLSMIAPPSSAKDRIGFLSNEDGELGHYVYSKEDGNFNTGSIKERLGAIYRGVDLIRQFPIWGVGPGRAVSNMSNESIPTVVNLTKLDIMAFNFYYQIKSGEHPTNPHNLFVFLEAENGLFFLFFLIAAGLLIFQYLVHFYKKSKFNIATLSLFATPLAFTGYYMFQAIPLNSLVLFFLFLLFFSKMTSTATNEVIP